MIRVGPIRFGLTRARQASKNGAARGAVGSPGKGGGLGLGPKNDKDARKHRPGQYGGGGGGSSGGANGIFGDGAQVDVAEQAVYAALRLFLTERQYVAEQAVYAPMRLFLTDRQHVTEQAVYAVLKP